VLKVDLHTHTSDDPVDFIPYTTEQLVDRAAELGFGALAITLHDRQRDPRDLDAFARERGIVLIRGVERTIQGRHVLLLNFPAAAESVESFEHVARLKARHPEGLVVAPHPFYPHTTCLRGLADRHADLFDAVEQNAFYTAACDFNQPARRWARAHGKPVVGNSDAHRLSIFGATASLVDAEPDADAICAAIRSGRVEVQTRPLSAVEAGTYFGRLMLGGLHAPRSGRALPADDLATADPA
jgi:predicted metal-dependent phosphoesterase TrpH